MSSSESASMKNVTSVVTNDADAAAFFCATTPGYQEKAGSVLALKASDWDNEHRKKHLDSFAKSTREWTTYKDSEKLKTDNETAKLYANDLLEVENQLADRKDLDAMMITLRKKHKCVPSTHLIIGHIKEICNSQNKPRNLRLEALLVKRAVRSASGVTVITVLTAPGKFSCAYDCAYCPNEPGQPRSYLSTEPAVMRANQNGWDPADQFWDRCNCLLSNGHIVDKLEVLVLGGTWSGYPEDYQEEFVRDCFYAANVYPDIVALGDSWRDSETRRMKLRPRLSLREEQLINEFSPVLGEMLDGEPCVDLYPKIIGLTLETRPDQITPREVHRLRWLGCTRVQMGVQHTDDRILKNIRRQQSTELVKNAIRLLKDANFKVDIHLMPDLPTSNPEQDLKMFELVLSDPSLQVDQWKIYPCEVTPFSSIEQWHSEGKYIPYHDLYDGRALVNVLASAKSAVHPWIRLNRVIRDIPEPTIIAGNNRTNLRQVLGDIMNACEWNCRCIRCREVREKICYLDDAHLVIRRYSTEGGYEYFISYESKDEKTIFAFLRLRICDNMKPVLDSAEYRKLMNPKSRIGQSFMQAQTLLSNDENDESQLSISRDEQIRLQKLDHDKERKTFFVQQDKGVSLFPELGSDIARIRELHVYGMVVGTGEKKQNESDHRAQHKGFGKMLLTVAEIISLSHGCKGLSVIAGIGVRNYYAKNGFIYSDLYKNTKVRTFSTDHVLKANRGLIKLFDNNDTLETNVSDNNWGYFMMKQQSNQEEIIELVNELKLSNRVIPDYLNIQDYDLSTSLCRLDPNLELETYSTKMLEWTKKRNKLIKSIKKATLKKRPHKEQLLKLVEKEKPHMNIPDLQTQIISKPKKDQTIIIDINDINTKQKAMNLVNEVIYNDNWKIYYQ